MSTTDALTGLGNRRFLDESIAQLSSDAQTIGAQMIGALMVDIDHFNEVNDVEGRALGDSVLAEVARRLAGQLTEPSVLGRYGGEEFLILAPGVNLVGAARLGERLRGAVAATAIPLEMGRSRVVTVSIGCAMGEAAALIEIIRSAESALSVAKGAGRNRVEVANTLPLDV